MSAPGSESAAALDRFGFVTPEIAQNLDYLVQALLEWQKTRNLVGRGTLDAVWTRHVADSLQLLQYAPPWLEWVDLGSGGGFPGLVVAIANHPRRERHVTLVESTGKKADFLESVIRHMGVGATVARERIETHGPKFGRRADIVSARALAPLPALLKLAEPYAHAGTTMLLLKGRDHVQEVEAASQSFAFDVVDYASATDSGGRVLAIRNLRPKARRP